MNINKLGKPIINKSYNSVSGSSRLFLKNVSNKSEGIVNLEINSLCNFQAFEKGLLLFSNHNNTIQKLPLPFSSIQTICLIKGQENIKPCPFTPFWFLLKFKLPIRYSRYFQIRKLDNYRIEETNLIIKSEHFDLQLITSGYNFENLKSFFLNLRQKDKFIMNDKTCSRVINN